MKEVKKFARGSWPVFAFGVIFPLFLLALSACHDAPLGATSTGDSIAVDCLSVKSEKRAPGTVYDPKLDSISKDTLTGGIKF